MTKVLQRNAGRNDNKQNGMDLLQRNFEMCPLSDKFWAIEDVMHLVNYLLITYKSIYVFGLLIS